MEHLLKSMSGGAAIAALMLFSSPATATVVTQGGIYSVTFDDTVSSGGTSTSLDASLTLSAFDFSGTNTVSFNVAISNDTQQGTLSQSDFDSIRLVSFGFNLDPDAISVTDTSTEYATAVNNQQPLPSIGKLDFCAYAGSNCAGGSNGGLTPGEEDTFLVTLTFGADISQLDVGIGPNELSGVKWQTDFGSFEFTSNNPDCTVNCTPIPEPGSLAVLGSGMLAMAGLAGWRRRRGGLG